MKFSKKNSASRSSNLQFLQGQHAVRQALPLLRDLAIASGQPEAVDDISYFLEKPGLLDRVPVLALVYRGAAQASQEHPNGQHPQSLEGAVLLFRYKVAGVRLGIYTSNDRSGRRCVIAPPDARLPVATLVTDTLHHGGAHVVMLSLRSGQAIEGPDQCRFEKTKLGSKIVRERSVPDYLALQTSLEATLAQMGKRTRTNMRYYRKRALELLHCTLDTQLGTGSAALLELNRRSTHPMRDDVARWRLRSLASFADPILMGLRDVQGDLLCAVAGRRLGDQAEILWQMNRGDLRGHSLSVVMRSFLIEHEITRGVRRLHLDGGTAHSLQHSFVKSSVTDMALLRRGAVTFALRKSARLLIPWDNELAHLLVTTSGTGSPSDGHKNDKRGGERVEETGLPCSR